MFKKLDLQLKQQKDTEKRDKYKIYGEMLHTYGYEAKPNDKSITVINYYDNKELTIPLDPDLSATENAKKYFDKYAKLKRTAEALSIYIDQSRQELELLQSIEASLNIAENEADLSEIRRELSDQKSKKANRFILWMTTASTFTLEKITIRMMSLHLSLPRETIGGSIPKRFMVVM